MKATPSVCGLSSSWCPEYNTTSPVASIVFPVEIHLVSLNPITSILYLCISFAIWAALPLWYMVVTFQVSSMDADLVFRRLIGIVASWLLSLQCVSRLVVEETLSTESKFIFLFVNVSVTVNFFTRRDSWSCAKPPTWRARDFTVKVSFP